MDLLFRMDVCCLGQATVRLSSNKISFYMDGTLDQLTWSATTSLESNYAEYFEVMGSHREACQSTLSKKIVWQKFLWCRVLGLSPLIKTIRYLFRNFWHWHIRPCHTSFELQFTCTLLGVSGHGSKKGTTLNFLITVLVQEMGKPVQNYPHWHIRPCHTSFEPQFTNPFGCLRTQGQSFQLKYRW